MENNNQNITNAKLGDNPPIPQGVNLNKKREELLSQGKIGGEVSSYLNEMGAKIPAFTAENPERPPATKTILKQSIVRTLKTDTEEAIKLEKMSSVSIALAEQKKKQKYPQVEQLADSPKPKKLFFIVLSLILIIAGVGAFNFNRIKDKITTSPEIAPVITSLISSDHNTELNLDELGKGDLSVSLSKIIRETVTKPNSIENIYITKNTTASPKEKPIKKPITSKEFLFLITSKTPDVLIRSLRPEYMLGISSLNGNHPFIILKTESYENAFAGMLAWEKNISNDLKSLLFINNATSNQEATNTEQILTIKKEFEDILIKNKDARALRDSNGRIVLIYSIPDKETILIATDTETLTELFNRVIRSRMVR